MKNAVSSFFALLAMLSASPALCQKAADRTIPEWIELIKAKDRTTRMSSAYAPLKLEGDPKASISAIIECLKDHDAYVRRYAANALGELRAMPELVVAVLMDALRDKDEKVRKHAVIALAKLGSPAVPVLVEALKQESV
jgi:HEAT repeat protein